MGKKVQQITPFQITFLQRFWKSMKTKSPQRPNFPTRSFVGNAKKKKHLKNSVSLLQSISCYQFLQAPPLNPIGPTDPPDGPERPKTAQKT